MKESGKAGGNLLYKELEVMKQRLEQDLKTMVKIARVKGMLEQNKKMDKSEQCMEQPQRVVETEEAKEDTHNKMCDIVNSTRERVQGFIERALKYDGNPEIMVLKLGNSSD